MMSKIIVGIDFSEASKTALRLSVDVANRTGADILMVWVEDPKEVVCDANNKLQQLVDEHRARLKGKDISYVTRKGKVPTVISNLSEEEEADLVVIGVHGQAGYDEKFAGKNTYKTVVECKCPVLTVREGFNFNKPLEKLIMPIDSTKDTRQKVPWTIEFAKMFPDCVIHVLGVQSYKIQTVRNEVVGYVNSCKTVLEKHGIPYVIDFIDSENSTLSTLEYAEKINADLIVIMTEQEKTLSNLFFLGPYAQQMLNLSSFPVLAISPKQLHLETR